MKKRFSVATSILIAFGLPIVLNLANVAPEPAQAAVSGCSQCETQRAHCESAAMNDFIWNLFSCEGYLECEQVAGEIWDLDLQLCALDAQICYSSCGPPTH